MESKRSVRCIFNVKFSLPKSKDWDFYTSTSTNKSANNFNTYITRKMEKLIPNEDMAFEQINKINEYISKINFDERVDWWEKKDNVKFNMNAYMSNPEKSKGLIIKDSDLKNYKFEEINPTLIKNNNNLKEAHEKSIAWHAVISFDEISSTEYDLESNQEIIANKAFESIMKHNNLDKNNFTYKAAFHTNTEHHHLHLTFYQPQNVKNEFIITKGKLKPDTFVKVNLEMNKIVNNMSFLFKPIYDYKINAIKEFNKTLKLEKEIISDVKDIYRNLKAFNNMRGRLNYTILPESLKHQLNLISDKICWFNKTPIDVFKTIVSKTYNSYFDKLIVKSNWTNKDKRTGIETKPNKTITEFKKYINIQKRKQIDNLYKDLGNKLLGHIKNLGSKLEMNEKILKQQISVDKYNHDLRKNKLDLKAFKEKAPSIQKSVANVILSNNMFNDRSMNINLFKGFKSFHVDVNKDLDNYWNKIYSEMDQKKEIDNEIEW